MKPHDLVAASGVVAGELEPFHSMIYFAPEADELYVAAGLQPGRWATSPAGRPHWVRWAPESWLPFLQLPPRQVAQFVPAAWSLAEAANAHRPICRRRRRRRLLGAEVLDSAQAALLARRAADACPAAGRPMAAALLELTWPTTALLVLWQR